MPERWGFGKIGLLLQSFFYFSCVVGVYGMRACTSRDEINQIFSKYGKIMKNFMVMDRTMDVNNPTFKGYAFLTFHTPHQAAEAAKAMNGKNIKGRQATVEITKSKPHWERQ